MNQSSYSHKSKNGVYDKTWYSLVKLTKKFGYKLLPHYHTLPVQGRVNYKTNTIKINTPCFICAINTLAHELGHIEDHRRNGRHPHKSVREKIANHYGYRILRSTGSSMNYCEFMCCR